MQGMQQDGTTPSTRPRTGKPFALWTRFVVFLILLTGAVGIPAAAVAEPGAVAQTNTQAVEQAEEAEERAEEAEEETEQAEVASEAQATSEAVASGALAVPAKAGFSSLLMRIEHCRAEIAGLTAKIEKLRNRLREIRKLPHSTKVWRFHRLNERALIKKYRARRRVVQVKLKGDLIRLNEKTGM
jgi:hypothetical protein